jgi:hypothetical protein
VDRDYLGQVLNCLWTGTANGRPSPTGFTADSRTGLWAYPEPADLHFRPQHNGRRTITRLPRIPGCPTELNRSV